MIRTATMTRPFSVPWRLVLDAAAWVGLAWFAWFLTGWSLGVDAAVYQTVAFPPDYSGSNVLTASYNYSPAFAFWVQPLQTIGPEAFRFLVTAGSLIALAYLITPVGALVVCLVQPPVIWFELLVGNINLLAAALVVLGLRHGWAWAPLLLTKVTPGIGLVWFAVRGEWRMLAIASAMTLGVALPALILAPQSWVEWITTLAVNSGRVGDQQLLNASLPLIVRAPIALGMIVYAARTDRAWLVPLTVAASFPINGLGWVVALGAWRLSPLIAGAVHVAHQPKVPVGVLSRPT